MIKTGQILYIVTDTDMESDAPMLKEVIVKQGGEKRIRVSSPPICVPYRTEYFITAQGTLSPPTLSLTPEAAFERYRKIRERDLELAKGTIVRCERQLEQLRAIMLDDGEEIRRCKECGHDVGSACSQHPNAGVNRYPAGSRSAGPRY